MPRSIQQVGEKPSPIIFDNCYYIKRKTITSDFDVFTFLNESYSLKKVGWDSQSISKLWRYNLHYFEFLLQFDHSINSQNLKLNLIEDWIACNIFGKGTAWEPYPTSLRITNWIKWHWSTGLLTDKALLSLWNQVRWLAGRPEYHLLGNHLFVNAKALLYASALFGLDSNSKIYKLGVSILRKELNEQFLADGAHFELSPMYHSLAMEDLLDLLSISTLLPNDFPAKEIELKYKIGLTWLKSMIYDNCELAHFNDCANGIAPRYDDLTSYANSLGLDLNGFKDHALTYHKESGFVVFKNLQFHLIADIGYIGPDYLPGHAHADTLSFELAIKGRRVIVNSGTSVYGTSPERHRQRATAAHSTVQLDGEDSSEVWSGFRVARRARPCNIQMNFNDISSDSFKFSASQDGYKRLKYSPMHNREWVLRERQLHIHDSISGKKNQVISRYYLHPDIQITKSNRGYLLSHHKICLAEIIFNSTDTVEVLDTTYHDMFGVSKLNQCIQLRSVSPCNFGITIEFL